MRSRLRFTPAMAGLILAPAMALAQAEVTALSSGSDPLESTADLRLSRFADFSEETPVAVGAKLEVGDLLTSASDTIDVEIACGEETVLRFSGGFRLLIASSEETDCAVDLLSGTVDALSDAPAEVGAGDVTLGVEGTQFSLSLSRTEEGPDRDLAVFEGTVRVRSDEGEAEVETGRTWKKIRGEPVVWGEVGDAKAERSAALYARLEVAKTVATGQEIENKDKTYQDLRDLHFAVLTKPADKQSRVDLARTQLEYQRDKSAVYHLRRAEVTTEQDLETYEIDKRVLPNLNKVRGAPGGLTAGDTTGGVAIQPHSGASLEIDPFLLLERGRYEQAIAIFKQRLAERANSKDYYGLARGYLGLEGAASQSAKAAAGRALSLHQTDHGLSVTEYRACRRIQAGTP